MPIQKFIHREYRNKLKTKNTASKWEGERKEWSVKPDLMQLWLQNDMNNNVKIIITAANKLIPKIHSIFSWFSLYSQNLQTDFMFDLQLQRFLI